MSKSKIFDLQTFTHYACEHTASECANYFEAKISNTIAYAKYHNIKFKPREYKGKANSNYKGGYSNTRLYKIYYGILKRCKDKKNVWYGGKGITVEFTDFVDFRSWALSNGYNDNLTIDRIDSNGNYSKANCRWVNCVVQSNNTSRNVYLGYKGEKHTIAEWARLYSLSYSALFHRLSIGWSLDKALNTKVGYRCQK